MNELKELASVLERVWKDLEVEALGVPKVEIEMVMKILKSEADNQEDLARAKQSITLLIEDYINRKGGKNA